MIGFSVQRLVRAVIAGTVCLASLPALAFGVVWDLSPATTGGTVSSNSWSNERPGQHFAEWVNIPTATAISGIDIYLATGSGGVGSPVVITIWNDAGGLPGTVAAQYFTTVNADDLEGASAGNHRLHADFPPFLLQASVVYWIGMAGDNVNLVQTGLLGVGPPGDSRMAQFSSDDTFSYFTQTSVGDMAFRLFGQPVTATGTLAFNPRGVGHIQYVPYFSTQEGNVTAVNVVNTDTVNGKVLKVRFRGASNSDDVYDFQVFLSPGDVWTAGISQGSDGRSRLDTADKSCTLPANVNGAFIASRTPSAGGNAETREGYIEILTMADIVRGDADTDQRALYTATKHVKGVAPCTSSVLTALTHENAGDYMAPPTTGIMANWTIINVSRIVAYSGDAAAIEARASVDGEPVAGRIVYWDQRPTPLTPTQANANTADPLLRGASPVLAGARYDLPDLSTPYLTDAPDCPFCQARLLSDAITATEIAGEFYSEASVGAQTDWVVSFPTRRYFAAVRYTGTSAPAIVRNATSDGNIYFTADNTELGNSANGGKAYQICTKLGTNAVAFYDREETPTIVDDIVISPGTPTQLSICGEVSVVGLNNASAANSATFGSVARSNVANGFTQGWGSLTVPQGGNGYYNGLPMLARQFTRVNNTQTNVFYGLSYEARVLIPGTPPPFSPAP